MSPQHRVSLEDAQYRATAWYARSAGVHYFQRSSIISQLAAGQKIFEYEIVRQLGQGGFAAVFEAHDRILNRQVAIKQLLLDKAGDEKTVKRFIQEARVAASLEHPNVVSLHALRIEDNRFYMIMEYLSEGSVRDLLDKEGSLPVEQAVELTIGICQGLAKFHEKGIIHRDIKAENILLTADGRPKIIDFGIAHVPETSGGFALTQVGFQPSTLLYSSPEQVRGEPLDARSDVYQIGELLYTMLTGKHYINLDMLESEAQTHGGSNQFRMQAKLYELLERAICEEMPAGLPDLWRNVGVLAGLVEKALAKQPQNRFDNTLDFAAALDAINITNAPDAEETHTQESRVYNKRGLTHVNMRNYEQAIYDYTQAIELDRQYAEAYNNRSAAHLMMGNYSKAVLDCNWTLELAPHFIAAYINLGIAHTGLRDYPQALDDYDKALKLDPENVYAFYNQGNTHLWMADYLGAITNFDRALKLDPHFVAAYVNRGIAYTEAKNHDQALDDFTKAIELNPNYVHAYYNRANVYRELRQNEKAAADYTKAIELNPEHPYAYENRGDCYAALGMEDQASDDYTRIILNTSSINPKRLTVARSMMIPATPLDFLTRK